MRTRRLTDGRGRATRREKKKKFLKMIIKTYSKLDYGASDQILLCIVLHAICVVGSGGKVKKKKYIKK